MVVPFRQIASTVLVPGYYAEADASRAGTGLTVKRLLIFGQASDLMAGLSLNAAVHVGQGQETAMFGAGSMLADMVRTVRKAYAGAEIHAVPLDNATGLTAASGAASIAGTATASGTAALYIGDRRYPVAVTAGDTAAEVLAALLAAIDGDASALVENQAITSGAVEFDSINAGAIGNSVKVEWNRGGLLAGETAPAGLTLGVTAMSGGAGTPALSTALAGLIDFEADHWIQPYESTVALNEVEAAMSPAAGRWRWNVLTYGCSYTCFPGALAAALTLGAARNNPFEALMPVNGMNEPSWIWTASFGGVLARAMDLGPARSERGIEMPCVTPPTTPFGWDDRNTILGTSAGLSTFTVVAGKVYLERAVTTYKLDDLGAADNAWMDVNTVHTYTKWDRLLKQLSRHYLTGKTLVSNGSEVPGNPNVVSPNTYFAECLTPAMLAAQRQGLVENIDLALDNSRVERNETDPTRLDVFTAPDFANPLYVLAVLHQFRLQYTPEEIAA